MEKTKETKKKKRTGSYNRSRGHNFETKIAKELRDLGFTGVVTARSESKKVDNGKIDLIDTNNKLPAQIQLKKTIATPQFFKIRSESIADPKYFTLIWSKQEAKEKNICTVGEVVMISKEFFYELLKQYINET